MGAPGLGRGEDEEDEEGRVGLGPYGEFGLGARETLALVDGLDLILHILTAQSLSRDLEEEAQRGKEEIEEVRGGEDSMKGG